MKVNNFIRDNSWQRKERERLLKSFYISKGLDGRFVFVDKGKLADVLQKELAIDTILQIKDNGIVGIEEKIIRWPGFKYSNYTLEIMTCTVPGHERKGWMYYAKCDVLLYCFMQEDGSMDAHALPFPKLQEWFFKNDRYKQYKSTITIQLNRTECKIIPIIEVWNNVSGCKKFHIIEATHGD
jgi:hypothetical protein